MKKIIGIFSLVMLLFSTFAPAFTHATGEVEELAKQLLSEELEKLGEQYNNSNESGSDIFMTLNNQNGDRELLTSSVNMNDQLRSINFTWDEIIVPDPDNVYSGIIIMDRNLGATVAGTGEGSYGFFYQWGNNYGFADTGLVEGTTTLATWSGDYSHRGYYGNKFISTSNSDYWSDNSSHNDLWGGELDSKDNNRGYDTISETAENRQGPCPEGWHVPSIGEWSKLVNFWFDYNHKNGYNEPVRLYRYTGNYGLTHLEGEIAPNLMRNDLLIPWAGLRYNSSNSSYQNESYGYGYYFSSTPSIYLYIYKQGFNPDQSLYNHINGYSVRCFKNVYDPEIFTISFDTKGGHDYENKLIAKGNKLILDTDPMKFGSTFEGWYKDEDLNELYDFNTPVTENFTLYAKWNDSFGTISISDPDNSLSGFTIMNKNLGAKNNGTGEDAFGYYYQWGNNHGFSTIRSYTTTLAEWNDDYEHEGYYGTQFVSKSGSYWLDGQEHPSLWGGENDNYSNDYGLDNISETAENRQGPCPEGYHIPSAGEWSKLVDYWKKSYTYENNVVLNLDSNMDTEKKKASEFINYFELPLQYNYEPYLENYDIARYNMKLNNGYTPIYGYYRSSTPSGSSSFTLSIYDKGIYPTNTYSNYRGQNIRCFSNEYNQEDSYTLTLYTNSGEYIDTREIRGNHKLTGLPKLTRDHSVLEGWYQDKNLTEMNYDFNEIVDGDLTFYAKWSCDYGYQMSDDGQSCEPISVKFNANGGKFTNNESIMIKNSSLKEISPEITEIRHTSNILDDGTQNGVYSENNRVDVVTIPGAKKLHIILNWGFEGSSGEGMRVWTGSHADYDPESHSDTAIEFDGKTWLRGPTLKVEEFDVDGDSVSFGIKTDAYTYWGVQYGYHATVTKDGEYVVEYENGLFDDIEEPKRSGYDFIGWYFSGTNDEYNPNLITTGSTIIVNAKWKSIEEKMQETPSTNVGYTSDTTVSIDNELNDEVIDNSTTISLVTKEVEDNEVVTGDDKVLVQDTEIQVTSDKTVEYQGGLEVYLEKTENNETTIITGTAKFSSPIAIKIPVSNGIEKVKIKVKHGDEAFGFKGLTLNPENECNNGEALNYKYRGEDVPVTGENNEKFAIIYTCSASTFVAYTESVKPVEPKPAAGGGRVIKQETKATEQEHNSADIEKESENTKFSDVNKSFTTRSNETVEQKVKKVEGKALTRGEVAVMTNILLEVFPQLIEGNKGLDEVTKACSSYIDEKDFTKEEKKAITRLCKLSIMGIHAEDKTALEEFMVSNDATNNEFNIVVNRAIENYNEKDFEAVKEALKKLENDEQSVVFGTVYDVFMSIKNIFN